MLPTLISNSEILYKAIKPIDHLWKQGSPSSAAFKDSKGLSVDRDGGRTKSDCISVLQIGLELMLLFLLQRVIVGLSGRFLSRNH
jgi:hypothetical protein